ncbi:MAG: PilZ domain-containing protein, partial [Gammaproteobacteria bacterium]|nr:PilZ domain-containing protein [Gammaproteobacteria bacterium]
MPRALFSAPKRTVRLQMDYKLDNWLDRRRSPRMPRATLGRRLTADLNGVELQIVDLSAAGLRLSCPPERFPALQAALADDCCQLCLRLPNQPVVTVRAQVRHSHT